MARDDTKDKEDSGPSGKAVSLSLFRRLLQFAKPHRQGFVLSILLLLFLSVLRVAVPLLIGSSVDRFLAPDSKGTIGDRFAGIFDHGMLLLGVAFASFGVKLFQLQVINETGQNVIHDLRCAVQRHILSRSLRFFDRHPVGTLITRVTGDIDTLNEFFISGLDVLVTDFTQISLIVVILFWIDWRMALVILAVVPFVLAWAFYFQRQARQLFRLVRGEVSALNAFMNEMLGGVRIIQAFRRERVLTDRFEAKNRALRDAHLKTVRNFGLFYPGMEFLPALGRAGILVVGNELVLGGELGVGDLVTFWFYLTLFIEPLRQLADRYNILQAAVASGERVFKVLDDKTALPVAEHLAPPQRLLGRVRFEGVDFSYDGKSPVLHDITFETAPGTHLAIVGATGSGKTTIISLLSRFYDPNKGRVLLDGIDVKAMDPSSVRRQIGVVLQDVFLFAGTVRENLTLGRTDLTDEQLLSAARVVQAERIIQHLGGLDAPVTERGSTLSAGEKQLLAFARTLAHDPAILVLDEATANIDTMTEALLKTALSKLIEGRTAIIIAHRLSTIQQSDNILVLHRGRIREEGTHRELLDLGGVYARLHRMQWS